MSHFINERSLTWDILTHLWLRYSLHLSLWNPYEWIKIFNRMKPEMSTADIIHKNNLFNEKEYFGINMIITDHFSHNPHLFRLLFSTDYGTRDTEWQLPYTRNDVFGKKSKIWWILQNDHFILNYSIFLIFTIVKQ